jgi:predicted ester cyclase
VQRVQRGTLSEGGGFSAQSVVPKATPPGRFRKRVNCPDRIALDGFLSLDRNKDVVRRHFLLISEGDPIGAAALYATKSRNHGLEVSREDILNTMEALVELNEKFTIHEIIAEGDWVACRAVASGRHNSKPRSITAGSGIYSLAEPKGQTFTLQHMHLFRIVDGQIVEHWANRDDLGAARQLGLELKPKRTGAD